MLTRKQHELLTFIDSRLKETGVSPSFEEMKKALDLKSKSGVHRLISALEERNFIRRLPNRARALKMPSSAPHAANENVLDIPLHGRIAAGLPIEALEGQNSLAVPAALLGPGDH